MLLRHKLLNDNINPLDQFTPSIKTQSISKYLVTSAAIDKLTPFKGHPFHLEDNLDFTPFSGY